MNKFASSLLCLGLIVVSFPAFASSDAGEIAPGFPSNIEEKTVPTFTPNTAIESDPSTAIETDEVFYSTEEKYTTIDLRVAAFVPQAERFRDVFGNVGPIYGIQATTQLSTHWEFWANFEWFYKSSKKQGCHCCQSNINIPDLSFGPNYLWTPYSNLDLYIGGGAALGAVILHNHSCCDHEKEVKFAAGVVAKSGLRWNFYSKMFFEIFADYLYFAAFFGDVINVGGLKTGGGFGVKF